MTKITQAEATAYLKKLADAAKHLSAVGTYKGLRVKAESIDFNPRYNYYYNDGEQWIDLTPEGGGRPVAAKNLIAAITYYTSQPKITENGK